MKGFIIRAAADPGAVEIAVYDYIGFGGISAQAFLGQLRALGNPKTIILRINSYGGEVFDGLAMFNLLRASGAKITTIVDGIAASMASILMMAGDRRAMPANAWMMTHAPKGGVMGEEEDILAYGKMVGQIKGMMARIYGERVGAEKAPELMKGDNWWTAQQCKDMGLIDEILPAADTVQVDKARALGVIAKSSPLFAADPKEMSLGDDLAGVLRMAARFNPAQVYWPDSAAALVAGLATPPAPAPAPAPVTAAAPPPVGSPAPVPGIAELLRDLAAAEGRLAAIRAALPGSPAAPLSGQPVPALPAMPPVPALPAGAPAPALPAVAMEPEMATDPGYADRVLTLCAIEGRPAAEAVRMMAEKLPISTIRARLQALKALPGGPDIATAHAGGSQRDDVKKGWDAALAKLT